MLCTRARSTEVRTLYFSVGKQSQYKVLSVSSISLFKYYKEQENCCATYNQCGAIRKQGNFQGIWHPTIYCGISL